MASLRGSEVVHVPNTGFPAAGTFRPGITPGSPSRSAALGPLGDVLGGVLGGLAGAAISGDRGPGEAQAVAGEGACVQHLHVSCGARGHPACEDWDCDEPECACACDEDGLTY